LGPFVDVHAGVAVASIPVFASAPECGLFESGGSIAGSIGATATAANIAGRFGLTTSLSFNLRSTTLAVDPVEPTRIFVERDEAIVQLDREYRRNIREQSITIDILGHVDLGDRFAFAAGPSLSTIIGSKVEQTDNVTGPGRHRFADGQASHAMESAHNAGASSIVVQLAATLARSFGAGPRTIEPYITARVDLTSRIDDASMRSLGFGAGVRIMFDVTPVTPPIEPIAVSRDEQPVYKTPHATLAIFGIDANGKRQMAPLITVRELVDVEHIPLVPAVFFDANADTIASRYLQTARDRSSSSGDARVVTEQGRVIDSIGSRLRTNTNARIELWGSTSSDESTTLAPRRAASVRNYLARQWGIDTSRVVARSGNGPLERSTEAGDDGRADNRRVEIASNNPAILAPITASMKTREFDPPAIELVPTIDAPEGIKRWTIDLEHRDKHVARFTNDSSNVNPMWSILSSEIDTALGTLAADLNVIDSVGAAAHARAETPIRLAREMRSVDRRVEQFDDRETIRHLLVAFEFDRHEPGAINERELDAIASGVRNGAAIRVVGNADRIGEEQHNIELARRRATSVADALRALLVTKGVEANIEIESAGATRARFTNDLPEGRFLSRGVEVIVD
ncbi:MAG: OmpA family protein, partial [bacterium]|nr:OmpA family protein [Candidatus Kapabacteria bacterium]